MVNFNNMSGNLAAGPICLSLCGSNFRRCIKVQMNRIVLRGYAGVYKMSTVLEVTLANDVLFSCDVLYSGRKTRGSERVGFSCVNGSKGLF